jgi:hypothetical protein
MAVLSRILYFVVAVAVTCWPLPTSQAELNQQAPNSAAYIAPANWRTQRSCHPQICRSSNNEFVQTLRRHVTPVHVNRIHCKPALRKPSESTGFLDVKCVMNLEKTEGINYADTISDLIGRGEVSISVREALHGEGDSVALLRCRYCYKFCRACSANHSSHFMHVAKSFSFLPCINLINGDNFCDSHVAALRQAEHLAKGKMYFGHSY